MDTKTAVKTLKNLRAEIDALLSGISDRIEEFEGLSIKLGPCKYTEDGSFTFKLEGTLPGGKSRDEQDYETLRQIEAMNTHTWQIDPTTGKSEPVVTPGIKLPPLGGIVSINKDVVVIVGARLRAKFNVIVQSHTTGKRTCYKAADIARLYAKQMEAAGNAVANHG